MDVDPPPRATSGPEARERRGRRAARLEEGANTIFKVGDNVWEAGCASSTRGGAWGGAPFRRAALRGQGCGRESTPTFGPGRRGPVGETRPETVSSTGPRRGGSRRGPSTSLPRGPQTLRRALASARPLIKANALRRPVTRAARQDAGPRASTPAPPGRLGAPASAPGRGAKGPGA